MHAHDHTVIASLSAAQGQLWANLWEHGGQQRGDPHSLVGVAGGEGRGIQVVVPHTVVVADDAIRGLLKGALGFEVVLLRKRGTSQSTRAR